MRRAGASVESHAGGMEGSAVEDRHAFECWSDAIEVELERAPEAFDHRNAEEQRGEREQNEGRTGQARALRYHGSGDFLRGHL